MTITPTLWVGEPADDEMPDFIELDVRCLRAGAHHARANVDFPAPAGPPKRATVLLIRRS
jgi:hypothetical protein